MRIRTGYDSEDQERAANLYWEAFGSKLGSVLGPRAKAIRFLKRVMRPDHAISAYDANGSLLGIAGFKTHKGALAGGGFSDLRLIYGVLGGSWRAILLSLLERDIENESFLMDGIFVTAAARGQGIGQALLDAVRIEAKDRGYRSIRLDVIDTNERAKALYLRNGFKDAGVQRMGVLRLIYKFRTATRMVAIL